MFRTSEKQVEEDNKLSKKNENENLKQTTSILPSLTATKSIIEIYITKEPNYPNKLTLPEYKDNTYEKDKEILVKIIQIKFKTRIYKTYQVLPVFQLTVQ